MLLKNKSKEQDLSKVFLLCLFALGICIFAGLVISFRTKGELMGLDSDFSRGISFENARFLKCFRKAMLSDFVFCSAVFLFGAGFPVSFLPGGYILARGFLMGCAAGYAAKLCLLSELTMILFALFISNVLILPLYILLFLISVRFSLRTCSCTAKEKGREHALFGLRVAAFFALMCVAEAIQVGTGILVLK